MFILYVGNFGPRHSTENHLKRTLEGMGHHVKMAQENVVTGADVAAMIDGYPIDLLLWTRTWAKKGWGPMLTAAKRKRIPSVAYHLDLYWTLGRQSSVVHDLWWKCDYVFTADGGSDARWRQHGVNHLWAPPGVVEDEAYIADVACNGPHVLFVGTGRNYHREWPYRPKLINWLRTTYRARFTHVGTGGKKSVRNHELNRLYASARVVVGDALCPGYTHPRYWSDRVPETLGRGGFLIHPRIEGLEDWFTDGRDLVLYDFGDFEGLKERINFYVAHGGERELIRRRGHENCRAHSTYRHRMETMLDVVFNGGRVPYSADEIRAFAA